MAEIGDLRRLENQLYQYHPELRGDSEDLKFERRNRLFMQLQSSQPAVQLVALDAVSSLTNLKSKIVKCMDVVVDHSHIISSTPRVTSPVLSLIESSGDEFSCTQRPRRTAARRSRASSIHYNSSEASKFQCVRKDDSPLSLNIFIPEVVKRSEKMEISIDLGKLDASQRLFASRVDELLGKRPISSHMPADAPSKENLTSNNCKDFQLPIATSSTTQTVNENNEKHDDEMLSRLISQVLVENHDAETLQATNLLDNINNNERSNYNADVSDAFESAKEQLVKKKQRKTKKSVSVDKGPPKKRGRKPKNKAEQQVGLEYAEMAKSDLAKYVELFSNSCNIAGSTTPAASSTVSQQLVTSTTHYLDANEQQPITYYIEGDWENGANCQLVQTDSAHVEGGQEEFNMAELVNYIDNVGDAGNAIARVLDGPATLPPVLTQNSQPQSNSIVPPPAHVSDVLLDLSKKSTISYSLSAPDIVNVPTEAGNQDLLPLDLSLKSSKLLQTPLLNTNLVQLEANNSVEKLNARPEGVFANHEYASFGTALDMPLIDLEDNINAFMQLTNNEVNTAAAGADNDSTDCALTIKATADNTLPICDFELGDILSESTVCNNNVYQSTINNSQLKSKVNDFNSNVPNNDNNNYNQNFQSNSKMNDLNTDVNSDETERNGNAPLDQMRHENDIPKITECLINPTTNVSAHTTVADVDKCESITQSNTEATCSQYSDRGESYAELSAAKQDNNSNIKAQSANVAKSSEDKTGSSLTARSIEHIDELHADSADLLFVDTETLTNNSKSSYDGPATVSQLDTEYNTAAINANEQDIADNEEAAYDLSAKEELSKSIDLEEDQPSHNVSVHLPMSQVALMETNSEEFAYDYEMGIESSQEKDKAISAASEKPQKQCNDENDANETQKSDICNDSGIGNSVVSDSLETVPRLTMALINNNNNPLIVSTFEAEEINLTSNGGDRQNTNIESGEDCVKAVDFVNETQELKETSHQVENESLNKAAIVSSACLQDVCTEKIDAVLTTHTNQRQVIERVSANVKLKEPDAVSNLSVLEMEMKMDVDCLDFEDEMEDDALSLATSCFNSSDDERCADMDSTTEAATNLKSNNSNEHNEATPHVCSEKAETGDDKCAVVKVESTQQCANDVPNEVLKKFKIPKVSLTTATAKHAGATANVATAAALPMVILPTNVFNKQLIKTEPDVNKLANLEKITRTVQNVCAVTPLTLPQPTYQPQTQTVITQNTFNTIKPLMRDVLKLPTNSNEAVVQDLKAAEDSKQIACRLNEYAGIGGDCRKSSEHTTVIANTFGVMCLPYLVNRCFQPANCELSHTLRDSEAVGKLLLTHTDVDLNIAYKFAYNHELLFRRYMHEFCRAYATRNNRLKLLNMVRDCERYPSGGKLLATIFHSLEYCGLNKANACRQVLSYSRDRSQETIDVLLDIILEADWTMFCDHIEKFIDVTSYKFRVNVLHKMAPTILQANDQRLTSLFFKCLVNLDSNDVGLVQTSPILMQLLELIKNGQICR